MATYAVIKPYGMLSQFTSESGHPGLSELGDLPKDVYPVGRLDRDSEGLLLLTSDNALKRRILEGDGGRRIRKTYHVQVEGTPTEEDLCALERPMQLKAKGKAFTPRPARTRLLSDFKPPWERTPPIRYRASIPTTWIELQIDEGKNRQVRRMTAAIGFPTLRLIRHAIGGLQCPCGPGNGVFELDGVQLDAIFSVTS